MKYIQGKEFDNKNGVFNYIIGENQSSFYVLRLGKKGSGVQNNVEKYNKSTFQLEWVKDVSFEKDLGDKIPSGEAFLQSYAILSKGKIYFIISILETRKNMRSVYAKTISADNGQAIGTAKLLAKEENFKATEKFSVSFSPDSSSVLIKSGFVPSERRGATTTFITAPFTCYKSVKLVKLDGYTDVFTKEMPLSDANGDLGITSVSTDNNGNLLCIYTHVVKEKDMFGTSAIKGTKPGIGKIPASPDSKFIPFDLNVGVNDHAYLFTNNLQYDKNLNYAVITGIFIDVPCKGKKNCERKEGTFFMKIDLNQSKIITKQHYYFDEKLHQYYKDLFDRMDDYERLTTVTSVIDKQNEDVYTISWGYRETILVTRFTKDGQLVWCKPLPRGIVTYKNGFGYAVKNGKFYMIYTDVPKNMELDINNFSVSKIKTQASASGANVVAVSIDNTGKAEQKIIRTFDKGAANFNPETIDNLLEQPPLYNLKNRDKEQFIRLEIGQ
ncbi:MAG TPA: hypothetical protein VFF27_09545 [Bacteroidia bacterium]|nr:hypothetical protein [Bacteroidia bacterium]